VAGRSPAPIPSSRPGWLALRLSFCGGSFSFPENEVVARSGGVRFPEDPRRVLESTVPAGDLDLDRDGAADLFAVSSLHLVKGENTFSGAAPQFHVQ
jgi:hypothetical protein